MIYGVESSLKNNNIEIPIEAYANQLAWYLQWYLKKVDNEAMLFSKKASQKAKIVLRWILYPNEKEFVKDYKKIELEIGNKTNYLIRQYTRCIMQLLGQVAECVVVDKCCSNPNVNRICMNIASFKAKIYESYSDISYDDYLAFSTSYKYLIYKDEVAGIYKTINVPDYNPNHTTKDIAWFKKDNVLNQLKVNIPHLEYLGNAKLQIKTTLDSSNLNLEEYYLTPVICFDLCNDIYKVKKKYPKHIIYSMREISPEIEVEIEYYFRILAAYAVGLTDCINITNIKVLEDYKLAELFHTPIMDIIKERELNIAGVIDLAEQVKKPVIINA